MVFTGYVSQFYEVDRSGPFWFWGAVSTVFYLEILVLVYRVIHNNLSRLPAETRGLARGVWLRLLISWTLYPGGYLVPVLLDGVDGVVGRQITYTFADITSKIIYGILLGVIARKISKREGFEPADQFDVTVPRGGITDVAAPGRI